MASEGHLAKLKEGVVSWNEWRKSFDGHPDLADANLSGADLRGADLSGTNLEDAKLNSAKLNGANLNNAKLKAASLSKASLRNADLSYADLRQVCFSYADLHKSSLSHATLHRAELHKANLSYAILDKANLSYADLSYADLRKADFSNAVLRETNLRSTYLNNASLAGTDLNNADFSGADLNNTNLRSADLNGANLSHANLSSADLTNAFLRMAQLPGSNLTAATLTGACIHNWIIDKDTQLDSVICEYIYFKAEWLKDAWDVSDRHPANPEMKFASGEFAKLFQTELETVDLVFVDGIDWKAFSQSFQDAGSQYKDKLSIQAIERKNSGDFVVRLEMPSMIDVTSVENYVKDRYERECHLLKAQYKTELHANDHDIEMYRQGYTSLTDIIRLLANQPLNVTSVNGAGEL